MSVETLKIGSLRKERLWLRIVIPVMLLLVMLPLSVASAFKSSLPWIVYARLISMCGLGALVSYLLSRQLPEFRFEIGAGELQMVSGVLRKRYPMSAIVGPVKLTEAWIPMLSFRIGRMRHWYSMRNLSVQEQKTVFMQLSAAAANNMLQPTREDARG
jgi:hypothetical protein